MGSESRTRWVPTGGELAAGLSPLLMALGVPPPVADPVARGFGYLFDRRELLLSRFGSPAALTLDHMTVEPTVGADGLAYQAPGALGGQRLTVVPTLTPAAAG